MTRDPLTIRPEPPRQPDVLRLLDDAEAQSAELYPVESRHHAGIDTLERHQVRFFVARLDGEAVGTGGYLPDGAGQAELKRLFVARRGSRPRDRPRASWRRWNRPPATKACT